MANEMDLSVPEVMPAMTLPNVALFPQALLPLHIFEPRYRHMLRDVLETNRIFAVAGLDEGPNAASDRTEPPHRVAGMGIVRACQRNGDGTSDLLLQGLCRLEITGIVEDEPYRRIRVKLLSSHAGAPAPENERLRTELSRLVGVKLRLRSSQGGEMASFLGTIDDPETFVDVAAFSLCEDPSLRQRLLETLDIHRRLELLRGGLRAEIGTLRLQRDLQGGVPDDSIDNN